MYCLRCGRDTQDDHVFCDLCHQNMDSYPVKPGTAIHLPHRTDPTPVKKKARRVTAEEQVVQLRKSLRRARAFIAVLILLIGLAAAGAFYWLTHQEGSNIGRNYNVDTTQQTD